MSQNEPLALTPAQIAEQPEISPAVAEVMERAHSGAMLEVEHFEAMQNSPFGYYGVKISGIIQGIRGIPVNSQELHEIIEYKKQIAANEERFRNAA